MCGRYVSPTEAAIERAYNLTGRQWQAWMNEAYKPSFNVAPSQRVPVLRVIRSVGGERRVELMRWGLIPYWTGGEPPMYSTINAMIEKLEIAPAWRGPWHRGQRCVMPAAGFYEWQVQPDGTKQPYYIRPADDNEVFSIAALWDRARTEAGEQILSCAIITMPANELLAEIHNAKQRMPLILPPEVVDTWLTGTPDQAKGLLVPYPSELMRAHRVSKRVNKPENDDPNLVVELEPGPTQLSLES
jgi:putative SOS response-associated peptidase YedK